MTYDEFNIFCDSLPATSFVVQWGDSQVWKVADKVFAIGGWEKDDEPAFTFKTTELSFDILRDEPGHRPAPYMASRGMKWIQQYESDSSTDEQLRYYLEESHRIVSLGLTKRKQKALGLNQG